MLKIKVWYKDYETNEEGCSKVLRNLKPRRYMCSWSFEQLMEYIKEELTWEDIKEELVEEIVIYNEKEHWQQVITKG